MHVHVCRFDMNDIPTHPSLELFSVSEDDMQGDTARLLITMTKIKPYQVYIYTYTCAHIYTSTYIRVYIVHIPTYVCIIMLFFVTSYSLCANGHI